MAEVLPYVQVNIPAPGGRAGGDACGVASPKEGADSLSFESLMADCAASQEPGGTAPEGRRYPTLEQVYSAMQGNFFPFGKPVLDLLASMAEDLQANAPEVLDRAEDAASVLLDRLSAEDRERLKALLSRMDEGGASGLRQRLLAALRGAKGAAARLREARDVLQPPASDGGAEAVSDAVAELPAQEVPQPLDEGVAPFAPRPEKLRAPDEITAPAPRAEEATEPDEGPEEPAAAGEEGQVVPPEPAAAQQFAADGAGLQPQASGLDVLLRARPVRRGGAAQATERRTEAEPREAAEPVQGGPREGDPALRRGAEVRGAGEAAPREEGAGTRQAPSQEGQSGAGGRRGGTDPGRAAAAERRAGAGEAPERRQERGDFQSFFEGVLAHRRTAARGASAPLNLNPRAADFTHGEALREGLVNVVRFVRADGAQRASVVVDPPALGRVTVELASGTSGVEASIKVASEQVRQLVQDQLTQLRMTLEQQGVQLAHFAVDVQQDEGRGQRDTGRDGRREGRRIEAAEDEPLEFRVDLEQGMLCWVA